MALLQVLHGGIQIVSLQALTERIRLLDQIVSIAAFEQELRYDHLVELRLIDALVGGNGAVGAQSLSENHPLALFVIVVVLAPQSGHLEEPTIRVLQPHSSRVLQGGQKRLAKDPGYIEVILERQNGQQSGPINGSIILLIDGGADS